MGWTNAARTAGRYEGLDDNRRICGRPGDVREVGVLHELTFCGRCVGAVCTCAQNGLTPDLQTMTVEYPGLTNLFNLQRLKALVDLEIATIGYRIPIKSGLWYVLTQEGWQIKHECEI